jgi:hypothetical protein
MSTNDSKGEKPTDDGPPAIAASVSQLNVNDGETIIYDRQNHQAWLQSDCAVEREAMA